MVNYINLKKVQCGIKRTDNFGGIHYVNEFEFDDCEDLANFSYFMYNLAYCLAPSFNLASKLSTSFCE